MAPCAGTERIVLRGPPVPDRLCEATGETLVELLDRAVARHPARTAMLLRGDGPVETWTYAEFASATRRAAARLRQAGVRQGDRVLTWAQSDPWLAIAYFGVWRLGATVVPLDLRMAPDVAIRIGRAAGASLVLSGPPVDAGQVAALGLPGLPVSRELVEPGAPGAGSGHPTTPEPDQRPPAPQAELPGGAVSVVPETLAEVLFTSGTTSDPKGVMITHGQMVHSVRAVVLTSGGLRSERILAVAPLSHAYGQMVPLFGGLVTGSQTTYLPVTRPARVVEAMKIDRITTMTTVPQVMELMLGRIEAEAGRRGALARLLRARRLALGLHLPMAVRRWLFRDVLDGLGGHLALLGCGGARLPEALQLAWEAMGIRVIQAYGATECCAIAGHERERRRPGTVGKPLAGIEVCIADDGELLARGPNATVGYWGRPVESAEVLEGGWVHTGDAARIEEHGELVILGRTRDRIALPNGMKVYPEDVEQALRAAGTDAVGSVVVLEGAPGVLTAIVVPASSDTDDEAIDGVVRAANATLAPHQRVRRWRRWPDPDFPRTHTLKVRRGLVADWYAGQVQEGETPGRASGEGTT